MLNVDADTTLGELVDVEDMTAAQLADVCQLLTDNPFTQLLIQVWLAGRAANPDFTMEQARFVTPAGITEAFATTVD